VATSAYIGAIFLFAGNFAPRNFMLCQGQLLPISQYAAGNQAVPTNGVALAAGSIGVTHQPPDFPGIVSNMYVNSSPNVALAATTVGANTGGGIPISIQNPFLAINYIICISGIFPSRN
jgi:microcystin-dependent protein